MAYDWINAFQDVAGAFREYGEGKEKSYEKRRQKELDEERKRQEKMQAVSFIATTFSSMRNDPNFALSPAGQALTQSAMDLGKQYGITPNELGLYAAGAMQNQPTPIQQPTPKSAPPSVNPAMMPQPAMPQPQPNIPQQAVQSPFNTQFNLTGKQPDMKQQFDMGAAMSPKPKVDLTQQRPNEFLLLTKIDKNPSRVYSPALGDLGEMTPQQFMFNKAANQIPSDAQMGSQSARIAAKVLDPKTRQMMLFLGIPSWEDMVSQGYEVRADKLDWYNANKDKPYNAEFKGIVFMETDPMTKLNIEATAIEGMKVAAQLGLDTYGENLAKELNTEIGSNATTYSEVKDAIEHPKINEQQVVTSLSTELSSMMQYWDVWSKEERKAHYDAWQKRRHEEMLANPRIKILAPTLGFYNGTDYKEFSKMMEKQKRGGGRGRGGGSGDGLTSKLMNNAMNELIDTNRKVEYGWQPIEEAWNKYQAWDKSASGETYKDQYGNPISQPKGANPYESILRNALLSQGYEVGDDLGSSYAAAYGQKSSIIAQNQLVITDIQSQIAGGALYKLNEKGYYTPQQRHKKQVAQEQTDRGVTVKGEWTEVGETYAERLAREEEEAKGESKPASKSGNRAEHK